MDTVVDLHVCDATRLTLCPAPSISHVPRQQYRGTQREYSVFIRQGKFTSFSCTVPNEAKGMEKIMEWSSSTPGEFVLFNEFEVVAVGRRGIVKRVPNTKAIPSRLIKGPKVF